MIRLFFILFFLVGCTYNTTEEAFEMSNCIGSQTSDMTTTPNLYTTIIVQPITNLQMDNLEPGEYTLQFEAESPNDGLGFFARAIVHWKVRGQQLQRIISIAPGAFLSGVAEAVDVYVIDYSGEGPLRVVQKPYKVFCTLSRGTRPNVEQPATVSNQSTPIALASGASAVVLVPPDAGVISVLVMASIVAPVGPTGNFDDITVQMLDGTANPRGIYMPWAQQTGPGWVPLVPGTVSIEVTNRGANSTSFTTLWGVDG